MYWTQLQNPDCDWFLREFRGAVYVAHTDPDPDHGPGFDPGSFPARPIADEAALKAWCQHCHESLGINAMGTVSIRDEVARLVAPGKVLLDGLEYVDPNRVGVITRQYARALIVRELLTMRWSDGRRGFPWPFVVAAEDTAKTGRWDVAHVHLGLRVPAGADLQLLLLEYLRSHFFARYGICRFEMMRDQSRANHYGLKDICKQVKQDPEALYVRAFAPRRRKRV